MATYSFPGATPYSQGTSPVYGSSVAATELMKGPFPANAVYAGIVAGAGGGGGGGGSIDYPTEGQLWPLGFVTTS